MSNITEKFNSAKKEFQEKFASINGVYDLLIRGTGSIDGHEYTENWSDLDLTAIVEKVTPQILIETQKKLNEIRACFPYKIGITVVEIADYKSPFHHHGIKPIVYSHGLCTSDFLLEKANKIKTEKIDLLLLKIDAFSNLSYLVHDLRARFINVDSPEDTALFMCHLAKRTKHIARNALFIITNKSNEEFCQKKFQKHFPQITENLSELLLHLKKNYHKISKDRYLSKKYIHKLINIYEEIYRKTNAFMAENFAKRI